MSRISTEHEPQTTLKCGCFIVGAAQFCKMHAAAPALYEALEVANRAIDTVRDRWTQIPAYASTDLANAQNFIQAALKKVGGQ